MCFLILAAQRHSCLHQLIEIGRSPTVRLHPKQEIKMTQTVANLNFFFSRTAITPNRTEKHKVCRIRNKIHGLFEIVIKDKIGMKA